MCLRVRERQPRALPCVPGKLTSTRAGRCHPCSLVPSHPGGSSDQSQSRGQACAGPGATESSSEEPRMRGKEGAGAQEEAGSSMRVSVAHLITV